MHLIKIVIFKISAKYFQFIKSRNYQESFSQPNTLLATSCKCFCTYFGHMTKIKASLNPSRPNPRRREKFSQIFIFTLLSGASKGFMKALKAPQRSVKIKNYLNFYFNITFRMHRTLRVNIVLRIIEHTNRIPGHLFFYRR